MHLLHHFDLPDPVRGVFAYLDATLPIEALDWFATNELGKDDTAFWQFNAWPYKISELITNEFRLMYWGAPIREALSKYRLFFKRDMATALMCAYALHRQGKNPNDALNADYDLGWHGVLTWRSLDEIKAGGSPSSPSFLWENLSAFYREGDQFVRYHRPATIGTLMVRGYRLVWDVVEANMTISKVSLKWQAEAGKFEELGGTRAFLAGEFDWPPAGWVNPVADEQEKAGRRNRDRL